MDGSGVGCEGKRDIKDDDKHTVPRTMVRMK